MDSFERPGDPLFDVGFVRAGSDTNINRSCRAMSHLLPINWSALGGSVDQQIANCKATLRALEPKGSLTTAEQAGYKMVLVLEGNGAASSMSWVLASGSTALIPTPTSAEVWVGSLARPGVHYLPLKQDLSDAADKAAWCVRNGAECGAIAAAAHALMRGAYFGRGPAPTPVDYAARMAEIERRVLRRVLRQVKAEPACDVGSRVGLDAKSAEWLADHNVTARYTRYRPEAPPRGKFRLPAP